jgi:DNA polymerase-3 subunit alpha
MKTKSHFSLKYGIHSPEAIVQWAVDRAYPYVFLADINSTGAVLAFVREAQRKGIPAVVGVELRNGRERMASIIVRNNHGLNELNVFLSQFIHQGKPFPKELPHFSSCYVCYPIEQYPTKLKEHEYIEIQVTDAIYLNLKYKKVPRGKLIALQSMIFQSKADFNAHRLLRAIDHNCLLSKLEKEDQADENERFMSYEEWRNGFIDYPEIIERTEALFGRCRVNFEFGDDAKPQNPTTYTGSVEGDRNLLKELCAEGLDYRYKVVNHRTH